MRSLTVALFAALAFIAIIATGAPQSNATEQECMIGDAALCLAAPNCWWDGERRGCYPGEAPRRDACHAHEDKNICNTSSLGCQWSEAASKCEAKSE